jgi:hypothetical protein
MAFGHLTDRLMRLVFVAVNLLVFGGPAWAIYFNRDLQGPGRHGSLALWTGAHLLSYFFLFPSVDCP